MKISKVWLLGKFFQNQKIGIAWAKKTFENFQNEKILSHDKLAISRWIWQN